MDKPFSKKQYKRITSYATLCKLYGIKCEPYADWTGFWDILDIKLQGFIEFTDKESYQYYLQWHEIVTSPLYKAMQEYD